MSLKVINNQISEREKSWHWSKIEKIKDEEFGWWCDKHILSNQ